MSIESWRARFPEISTGDRIHLNNCSVGPIPETGLEAADAFKRSLVEEINPWEAWLETVDEAVERFAELINADVDEVAIMTSATQAISGVASAFDFDERDEVVTSDLDFPTVPHVWHAHESRGATVRYAESGDRHHVPAEAYIEELSDRTQLVCTAHAYPFTGGLLDVEPVADAVHDRGGYLFLDAYQSAGIVPIDVKAQNIDMLTAGSPKFLLGGPGMAFLYVDRDVANELEPTARGWFGVKDRFDFPLRDPEYAPGTRRFEMGTPPVPSAFTANAGLETLLEYGIENVRERVVETSGHLIEAAEARGYSVATPRDDERRAGVVNVQVENPDATLEALHERNVKVSGRNGGIRAGVHFFNTESEMDAFVDVLDDVTNPR
ncbi:aminotransferase class V-fold PLP-dependent enzyme [Halovivax gelatinilyticus]|uniref:aminotransferase class V-fold PLP-dependent enzyme n=1 Tax=Halovivax gelatinilyticus TaxID=2961597 RepID=UPI0020CA64F9|nr:aminotransferase class V-fold PLP-dependent enzyme [Halovivax gelatinilyticus]